MKKSFKDILITIGMKEVKFRKNTTKGRKKIADTSNDLRRFIRRKRHFEKNIFPKIKMKFGIAA